MISPRRLAALDLGTNSARLAVADVAPDGALDLVVDERIPCRLGQGMARTGRLLPEAQERALQALRQLAQRAREAGAERLCAVATYALRSARDGEAFVQRAQRELGVVLRVLSGAEEARLVLRAARRHSAPEHAEHLVCLDLGGGSLELAREQEGVAVLASLPLGAVLMASHLAAPTPASAVRDLQLQARALLSRAAPSFEAVAPEPVASGGTVTSAARLLGHASPFSGARLRQEALESLLARVAPLDLEARRGLPGLPADHAEIIVAGLSVLSETLSFLHADALRVNEHGVREGVLLAMHAGEM